MKCTCLEVFGEDPDCPTHGISGVIDRLRDMAAAKHDDLSVADDAADIIEDLRDRLDAQLAGHRESARQSTANLLRAEAAEAETARLAARIEELEGERDDARQLVAEANNSLYGSQGYFHSLNGGPFDKYHLANGIERLKALGKEAG